MSENDALKRLEQLYFERHTARSDFSFKPLTPDASTREYFRVNWFGKSAIACVYPQDEAGTAQFSACLDVTELFLQADLPVARILTADSANAIIIHEDFGDTILRDVLENSDAVRRENYLDRAIALIARIQAATPRAFELDSIASRLAFDFEKLSWELDFFATHYFETLRNRPLKKTEAETFKKELDEVAGELAKKTKVLTHRDFHAANLMLHNGALKIIDHQDARIGAPSYDLVSLLLDRVTTLPTPAWMTEKRRYFLAQRENAGLVMIDEQEFGDEFRLQTVQRCLKAIGTFSFQAAVRGKTQYLQYINPMFAIVWRSLRKLGKYPTLEKVISAELQ